MNPKFTQFSCRNLLPFPPCRSHFPGVEMTEPTRPDPPVVGKVTHSTIQLYWDVNEVDEEKPTHGKVRYSVQEEEVGTRNVGFGTVYSGFARSHVFEGLEPQMQYRYQLRRSNNVSHSPWSVVITVNTTRKPKTSEDLVKAVGYKDLEKVDAILQGIKIRLWINYYIIKIRNK